MTGKRWTTRGGKRRYVWRPPKATTEQDWQPAQVDHDDYRLWQGRYWPAATLRAQGHLPRYLPEEDT